MSLKKFHMRRLLTTALLPLCAWAYSGLAHANEVWPERTLRLLVPSEAGGSADTLVRPLAEALTRLVGKTVVVENRGGVGGVLGANIVAKTPPSDGHLFLLAAVHHTIAPAVLPSMPYDTVNDFSPVAMIARMPNVLVVNTNSPIQSVAQLIEAAKKSNTINYGTSGVGTMLHLTAERFTKLTDTKMTAIHYKGSSPAMLALIGGGQIDLMFETMPSALQQIRAGKLRALAVTSPQRSPWLPDVPTLAQAGVPDLAVETWYGVFAPGGTDPAIVGKMADYLEQALASPSIQEVWRQYGAQTGDVTPKEFPAFVKSELAYWKTLAEQAKLEAY